MEASGKLDFGELELELHDARKFNNTHFTIHVCVCMYMVYVLCAW